MIKNKLLPDIMDNPYFETFVVYLRGNGKYTVCAKMKTRRFNETYKEDNLPEYSPIVFKVENFDEFIKTFPVEERIKVPVTCEFPVNNIFRKYRETFKMLEEYDRGILPEGHNQRMEVFKESILNGAWEALSAMCFDQEGRA